MIELNLRGACIAVGAAGLAAVCAGSAVQAQVMPDVIGATVGNAIAAQRAYEAEQACLAGKPVEEKVRVKAEAAIEATMADYFRHAAAPDQEELRKLFMIKAKDVRWSTRSGLGEIGALQDPYAPQLAMGGPEAARATRLALVVAGDGGDARGLWRIDTAAGAPLGYYGVDFKPRGKAWLIWHMSLFTPAEAPPAPEAYCHFETASAY